MQRFSDVIDFEKEILDPVLYFIQSQPERNAFFINDTFYSYKDFGGYIVGIRKVLSCICDKEDKVGLVINNDIQTYAAIFALWLEGKCYVPLHPYWPLERCEEIVEQIGLFNIIDSSPETRYKNVNVIKTDEVKAVFCELGRGISTLESALAYVLFTSGSTGKPKGIQISRQNVAAFLSAFWKTGISIDKDDRCLQCFDLSFDVSVQSYLSALTRGACVYTVPSGEVKFLSVAGLIDDKRITFGAIAPSILRYLQPYFAEIDFSSLRQCIVTAEACPIDLIESWKKYARNVEVYDFYGPTETTIYCTSYKLVGDGRDKTYNGIVSIGKPLDRFVSIIIDEEGKIVKNGEKGELCMAGPQLFFGYWNDEEKNAKAFFNLEYEGEMHRFYHTGDLCFVNEDGNIMYSGRIDNQAKIQGFRVELSEIEYHAHAFLQGVNVVCVAYENEKKITEIVMFVESSDMDAQELIAYLRTKMPQYMIPAKIVFEQHFPINANGKIDRKKLKSSIICNHE